MFTTCPSSKPHHAPELLQDRARGSSIADTFAGANEPLKEYTTETAGGVKGGSPDSSPTPRAISPRVTNASSIPATATMLETGRADRRREGGASNVNLSGPQGSWTLCSVTTACQNITRDGRFGHPFDGSSPPIEPPLRPPPPMRPGDLAHLEDGSRHT